MGEGIHINIAAEKLGTILGFPITNTLITSWAVLILLAILAFLVGPRIKMIPGRFQTLLEEAIGFVYSYVEEVLESKKLARRFFPLLMTIFLFIFTANMLEFIPGFESIGFYKSWGGEFVPLLRSINTDLNVPLMLAIVAFFVIQISGIVMIGAAKYAKKFMINPIRDFIGFFVGLVEFIGEFARAISLAFRLFGNILAGEVVIAVAIFFVPYLGPIPFMLFEIFIGTLQAAIFALLTLFFIKLAVSEPHGEEAH